MSEENPEASKEGEREQPQKSQGAGKADAGLFTGYAAGKEEDPPLGSYAALVGVYGAAIASLLIAAAKKQDRQPPERLSIGDVLLLGVATHKLSRLVSKDWVTSPLRATFVRYEGEGNAPGEVEEKARGTGMQRALGELFT